MKSATILAAVLCAGLMAATAQAQNIKYSLKVAGIQGEVADKAHSGDMEVASFTFHAAQPGTASVGGGASAGRAQFGAFKVSKRVDTASPKLLLACTTAQHIQTVIFSARQGGPAQVEFLKYTLTDVLVTRVCPTGSGAGIPMEDVEFTYGSIQCDAAQIGSDGKAKEPVTGGWDLKQNKPIAK